MIIALGVLLVVVVWCVFDRCQQHINFNMWWGMGKGVERLTASALTLILVPLGDGGSQLLSSSGGGQC
jgi:hypothetical protein